MTKHQVLEKLQLKEDTDPVFRRLWNILSMEYSTESLPVVLDGSWVMSPYGGLDLAASPRIFHLFKLFIEGERRRFSREELLMHIYQTSPDETSPRLRASLHGCLIKLISRARKLAERRFSHCPLILEWFPYDPGTKTWQLVRVIHQHMIESAA